jgi:2-oxoglutarate dehydrogenase E2 component (dihydrolipoamide succinyltransferase)
MAVVAVKVPSPGESVAEGTIAKWYVASGTAVKVDQKLFDLESDKATLEVLASVAGVVKIIIPEKEIVSVGTIVAEIDPAGVASAAAAPTAAPVAAPAVAAKTEASVSPAANRILAEKGVSPAQVAGTGPKGLITKEDAAAHPASNGSVPAAKPAAPVVAAPVVPAGERERREPMSMIRRRIAQRLLESQTSTATLTTFNEVDMSTIMDLRTKYNEKFEKKYGVKIGFMSMFVKAAIDALKLFPLVNARIDGNDIVYQNYYDISVAVSTDKGLTVPVIRNADQLHFSDIEKEIGNLAKKARDGKLTPADMLGGTFTITNGGIFGSMMSTPILNPPQTAILGMHAINKRPVVVNDEIVIRPMMYLALSYDHRLIDGREAVQFLVRIKDCVENPERILFGI